MNKIYQESLLYDFYGELLTKRQQEIFEHVKFEDLSLSEAAEEYGISRQGIHDLLRRSEETLQAYEDKLGLVAKFMETKEAAGRIRELCCRWEQDPNASVTAEIRALADKIENL